MNFCLLQFSHILHLPSAVERVEPEGRHPFHCTRHDFFSKNSKKPLAGIKSQKLCHFADAYVKHTCSRGRIFDPDTYVLSRNKPDFFTLGYVSKAAINQIGQLIFDF